MTMELGVLVRLGDRLTGPLRGVVTSVTSSSRRMTDSLSKTTAGLRKMGKGLGGIAAQTRGVAIGLAAYSGTMAGLALSFVAPAAQMERFRVQLTSLEGGSAGAEKALAWISDFATRTPLEMTDTIAAYSKLKAFGIDPTNGSLQAMVDTMAATGGGVEQLDGLVMALGQAWSKGKLQSEEALQLLERGVPVWDLLAAKMGKSSEEVQALASAGKLGRDEIALLMEALGEKNAGAGDGMSKTWGGILSNLMDHWTRFQLMVMDSGVFDALKSKLQVFLDLLNQMAADGRLKKYADILATNMLWAIEGLWNFGKALVATWRVAAPMIEAAANAVGGWDWFLALIAGGALAPKIIGLGKAFLEVGAGLLYLARLAMGHPLIAAIAVIAAGAALIYRNWGAISAWFSALWDGIVAAFQSAWDWIKTILGGLADVTGITDAWQGLKDALTSVMDWMGGKFDWLWQKIGPVIEALRWVKGKGAAALQKIGLSGGDAGGEAMANVDASGNVTGYANGGSFGRGPIVVGERGPELRYENRGGFIAHNRALRQMAGLSARAGTGQGVVDTSLLRTARADNPVHFAPRYNVTIHANSGGAAEIEAAVKRALAVHHARAMADSRRDLHD